MEKQKISILEFMKIYQDKIEDLKISTYDSNSKRIFIVNKKS